MSLAVLIGQIVLTTAGAAAFVWPIANIEWPYKAAFLVAELTMPALLIGAIVTYRQSRT